MTELSRRGFLATAGAAAAACAPAAAPVQTGTIGGTGWEADWERLVSAAKQEGALAVISLNGVGYRRAFEAFASAFPGIGIDHQQFSSASLAAPKIIQERSAGVHSFDIARLQTLTGLGTLKRLGALAGPVHPARCDR
jgi:hypothetical protein